MNKVVPFLPVLGVFAALLCLQLPATAAEKEKTEKTEKPANDAVGKGGYAGYGKNATGGAGKPNVEVKTFKELSDALKKGEAVIVLKADIVIPRSAGKQAIESSASNITLDGEGHTIYGDNMPPGDPDIKEGRGTNHVLKFNSGKNFIIKNLRMRNCEGGGHLCFYKGASDIVIDRCSLTGACNKAIAIENGSHDATVTNCFMAGNTRALFFKYENTRHITMDHNVVIKLHLRAPLADDVDGFDVRNNLIMDWNEMGTRLSGKNCNGNVMGNIYAQTNKNSHRAILFAGSEPKQPVTIGKVHIADNVFRNCSQEPKTKQTADKPLDAPAISPPYTTDLEKVEKALLSETEGAGCMPRDAADKAYLTAKEWKVTVGKAFIVPEALPPKESQKEKDTPEKKTDEK